MSQHELYQAAREFHGELYGDAVTIPSAHLLEDALQASEAVENAEAADGADGASKTGDGKDAEEEAERAVARRLLLATVPEPGDDLADPSMDYLLAKVLAEFDQFSAKVKGELVDVMTGDGDLASKVYKARMLLERYRPVLSGLLNDVQLGAAILSMHKVATTLPEHDSLQALMTLPPEQQFQIAGMIAQAKAVPVEHQDLFVAFLPPQQKLYVQAALKASSPTPLMEPPPDFPVPTISKPEEPEKIHLPLIEEAAKDLANRRVVKKADYESLSNEFKWKSFTIAGIETEETIQRVQEILVEQVQTGPSYPAFVKQVKDELGKGTFLSPNHADTVFRTVVQTAYSRGMDKILEKELVNDFFPYEATIPIYDDRLTELCKVVSECGIQGTNIFRRDDPVYIKYRAPRHWRCRCGRIPYSISDAAAKGIEEAKLWKATGKPPETKAWVPEPPVRLPNGWSHQPILMSAMRYGEREIIPVEMLKKYQAAGLLHEAELLASIAT